MKSAKNKRSVRKTSAAAKPKSAKAAAVRAAAPVEACAEPVVVQSAVLESAPVLQSDSAASEAVPCVVIAENENPAVALPVNCCLRDAAELKASLLQLVDHEQTVLVDANAVERIDTAAMQVLVSFARERMAAARVTEWRGMNQNFLDAVRLLGLGPHLQISLEGAA